jgi:SWI/SNF-related matrix-associated actin-dependent regulator 1 of chromatin subfamily A
MKTKGIRFRISKLLLKAEKKFWPRHKRRRNGKKKAHKNTVLYPYQKEGVIQIERFNGRALLADEMGLGKTIQALYWGKNFLDPKDGPIIVVCPATLKINWKREALQHLGWRSEILGSKKPWQLDRESSPIFIINYDVLNAWLEELRALRPQFIILDEVHYIKNKGTQRTKATRELTKRVKHIVALSGTPMTNRPAELWPILNILYPHVFPSFFDFGQEFCQPEKTFWGWVFRGATHLKRLHRRLRRTCMIRRRKVDVLKDLPAKTNQVVLLPLVRREEYDFAVRNFAQWLRKYHAAKASRALRAEYLARWGYLRRLVAELKYPAVQRWLDDRMEEAGSKIIVFGVHKKVLKPMYEHFNHRAVLVDGSVTGMKRQKAIDKFVHDKDTDMFLGNIQAAGVGWNGTVANSVAFAELAWTPGEHVQAADRAHRIGQKLPVNIYFLLAQDTIEEKLCEIVQAKSEDIDVALDGRKLSSFNIRSLLDDEILSAAPLRRR